MFVCLHKYNRNIIFNIYLTQQLFHYAIKNVAVFYALFSCGLTQEKKFFLAKTLQFNVNLHTSLFTFHLHTRLSQETKSNRCNQIIKVFLQRDFRLKVLTKYCIQA